MKIKKALCLALATVMTASLAAVPTLADTPAFGGFSGIKTPDTQREKSDAQKVLEMIPDMEYTAENVRVAVYTMGVSGDMTYAFKEMLNDDSLDFDTMPANQLMEVLATLGVKDMAGLANFIEYYTSSWQVNPISLTYPEGSETPYDNFIGTTITISNGNNTASNTYTSSLPSGSTITSSNFDSLIGEGITIEAAVGYKLKSVTLSGTNMRATKASPSITDLVPIYDLVADTKNFSNDDNKTPEKSVTLKKDDLKRKASDLNSAQEGSRFYIPTFTKSGNGLFGSSITTGTYNITVETEPAGKGNITVKSSSDSTVTNTGLFTFNGGTYNSISSLNNAITREIGNANTKVGDVYDIGFDTTFIDNIDISDKIKTGASTTSNTGSIEFKVPDDSEGENTITVTFKTMSNNAVKINAADGSSADDTAVYTFNNQKYQGMNALAAAINIFIGTNTPENTQITFSYDTAKISSVKATTDSDSPYNIIDDNGTVSFNTSSKEITISITFVEMSKAITVKHDASGGEDPGNITYTFDGREYHSINELSSALGSLTSIAVGKQYTITYDDPDNAISKIENTDSKITGFNANTSTKRITFTTSTNETQKITVTFKKKAGNITFEDAGTNGLPNHVTSVNVTSGATTRSFTSATDLNKYLTSLYEGTVVNFTFFLDSGYSITSCTDNDSGVAVGNALNQYSLTNAGDSLTIKTESSDPRLTVLSYLFGNSGSIEDKLGSDFDNYKNSNGAVAIAEVTNAAELSDDALNGASITLTANNTTTSNPNMPEENKSVSETFGISKDNTFAGIAFVPKDDRENTIFNYSYNVNAALTYNSGQNSKNGQTTVTIIGIQE